MQELLVLGLIPGTNIQITFISWLLLMLIVINVPLFSIAHRRHTIANALITAYLVILQARYRHIQA